MVVKIDGANTGIQPSNQEIASQLLLKMFHDY